MLKHEPDVHVLEISPFSAVLLQPLFDLNIREEEDRKQKSCYQYYQ